MKEKKIKKAVDNLMKTIIKECGISCPAMSIEYTDLTLDLLLLPDKKYKLEINRK